MKYSVLVPLGYSATWLSRELISNAYSVEPVNDRQVDLGSVEANMGAYWLLEREILVLPTSPRFVDEGNVQRWAGDHLDHARKIVGLGWCGSYNKNTVGEIIVPDEVALSPRVKSERPVTGNGRAHVGLRADLIRAITEKGFSLLEGTACTYLDTVEPRVLDMMFADMEAGILIRYGNNKGIHTAVAFIVSDDPLQPLPEGQPHEWVANPFFDSITSSPLKESFEESLDSALGVLRRVD